MDVRLLLGAVSKYFPRKKLDDDEWVAVSVRVERYDVPRVQHFHA